jgi:hypothetical protein
LGNQPTQVVEAAEHRRTYQVEHEHEQADASRRAVTFARDRNLEREAVVEERALLRDAMQRSRGEARIDEVKQEVDRRVERGDFIAVEQGRSTPGRSFTTPSMMDAVDRDVSHRCALETTPVQPSRQSGDRDISKSESIGHTMAGGSR